MVTFPASFGTDFLANVTTQLSDPGLLTIVLIVLGVPFAFWLIKKVYGLIPKSK